MRIEFPTDNGEVIVTENKGEVLDLIKDTDKEIDLRYEGEEGSGRITDIDTSGEMIELIVETEGD